jgi:hypothetical protein
MCISRYRSQPTKALEQKPKRVQGEDGGFKNKHALLAQDRDGLRSKSPAGLENGQKDG